jgi:photosystem II oxygen-evolving enhancer protein 3
VQIVAGFVAGVASLAGKASADVTPVDLFDDRKKTAKGTGFDLIYEARDLDLPQNTRDGITQFKSDLKATKARYSASAARIEGPLGEYINKSYWCASSCCIYASMRLCLAMDCLKIPYRHDVLQ